MLFNKEELLELIYGGYDEDDFEVMETTTEFTQGGFMFYTIIFKYLGRFYKLHSTAKELKAAMADIECLEVKPVVKPTVVYEVIQ